MPISFVALGNPLLDMQVTNGEALLEKYNLKANDAILAEGTQNEIYEDIKANHPVTYVAGGAAQNAARAAQYVLPAGSTGYLGAVGKDDLAKQLRVANEKEGLQDLYYVNESLPTGACAVVITGHHRSLCTTLAAAETFTAAHLSTPDVVAALDGAKAFYQEGFFLTHGLESAKIFAEQALSKGKIFSMNLSAPFIPQFFKDQVDTILPYCDILIGNESEAEAYAVAHDWEDTKNLESVATKIAETPIKNASSGRIVVITQGALSTIVATHLSASSTTTVKTYAVAALPDSAIVDTNGAGDCFAGGFMGAFVQGKPVDECVEVGHRLGAMCVGQIGPQLAWPKVDVLSDL